MPAVKPVVIGSGIYLRRLPNLQKPMIMRMIPAMIVAMMSPCVPSFITIPATIVAKAAVGPAIWTLLPPRNDTMNPATIAV